MSQKPIEIGDRVYIKGAEVSATVTGIMMEQEGLQYRVIFWHEGRRQAEWLFQFEIEIEKVQTQIKRK
jgi:hypothetical protein